MGEVYKATDLETGREVAVKALLDSLAVKPEAITRFQHEGEALRELKHPNIVGFLEAFQHNDRQILVMEYVPGGSLSDLLTNGPLPIEQARGIALELCDALTRAHHRHIIHRDLKPGNILLAEDGSPLLSDFGVARLTGDGRTRLTNTGVAVGTPDYMPPEAWRGQPLDERADIWALGVTLFEMLTGRKPFSGSTISEVMYLTLNSDPPEVQDLRPDVPPGLAAVIAKMLRRDLTERYQNARDVAADLARGAPLIPLPPRPGGEPTAESGPDIAPKDSGGSAVWRLRKALDHWTRLWRPIIAAAFVIGITAGVWQWAARPALAEQLNNRGVAYYVAGELPEARTMYEWALWLDADYAVAHYNLGQVYEDLLDDAQARDEYRLAIEGGLDAAYNNLGHLYILARECDTAAELLIQGLDRAQDSVVRSRLLKNLGWARLCQGRQAEAEANLREAIALDPEAAAAHCLLAQVLDTPTLSDEALPEWEACLRAASSRNPDEDKWIEMARERLGQQ